MRTGQCEDLFLGQAGLAGQPVKGGQQPIQFAFIGEQVVKETRGFRGGQAADFFKHFSGCHILNLALAPSGASRNNPQKIPSLAGEDGLKALAVSLWSR